jgi:hypothetical protein
MRWTTPIVNPSTRTGPPPLAATADVPSRKRVATTPSNSKHRGRLVARSPGQTTALSSGLPGSSWESRGGTTSLR